MTRAEAAAPDDLLSVARQALAARDHAGVAAAFEAAQAGGAAYPRVMRAYIKSLIKVGDFRSARKVLQRYGDALRPNQRASIARFMSLERARRALEKGEVRKALQAIKDLDQNLTLEERLRVMEIRVLCELSLERPQKAAQAVNACRDTSKEQLAQKFREIMRQVPQNAPLRRFAECIGSKTDDLSNWMRACAAKTVGDEAGVLRALERVDDALWSNPVATWGVMHRFFCHKPPISAYGQAYAAQRLSPHYEAARERLMCGALSPDDLKALKVGALLFHDLEAFKALRKIDSGGGAHMDSVFRYLNLVEGAAFTAELQAASADARMRAAAQTKCDPQIHQRAPTTPPAGRVTLITPRGVMPGQAEFLTMCDVIAQECRKAGVPIEARVCPVDPRDTEINACQSGCTVSNHTHKHAHQDFSIRAALHLKLGYLPSFWMWDREGYSGWSEVARAAEFPIDHINDKIAEAYYEQLHHRFARQRVTKRFQAKGLRIEGEAFDDAVFYPMQTLFYREAAHTWVDGLEALDALAAYAEQGGRAVAKKHPSCRSLDVSIALKKAEERGVIVTEASIHDIIPRCKAVMTVNSGVGFEALLHLKPVLVMGNCEYKWAARQVKTRAQLEKILREGVYNARPRRTKRFLYKYLTEYCVDIEDRDALRARIKRDLIDPILAQRSDASS